MVPKPAVDGKPLEDFVPEVEIVQHERYASGTYLEMVLPKSNVEPEVTHLLPLL